jgi:hypothetical protein
VERLNGWRRRKRKRKRRRREKEKAKGNEERGEHLGIYIPIIQTIRAHTEYI